MKKSYAPVRNNFQRLVQEKNLNKLVPDLNKRIFIDMSNAIGTGNIISTSDDLLSWNKFLHTKINSEIKKIIFKKYFKDQDGDWINLGLTTSRTNFGSLIGFQGGQDSYHSFLGYLPKYQLNIVILTNNTKDFEKLINVVTKFLR